MSCGKPVIAAGTHGYFGLVQPSNFAQAWSVYFGDHAASQSLSRAVLTRGVRDLVQDRTSLPTIGSMCREWVTSQFSIQHVCDQLLNLYVNAVPAT